MDMVRGAVRGAVHDMDMVHRVVRHMVHCSRARACADRAEERRCGRREEREPRNARARRGTAASRVGQRVAELVELAGRGAGQRADEEQHVLRLLVGRVLELRARGGEEQVRVEREEQGEQQPVPVGGGERRQRECVLREDDGEAGDEAEDVGEQRQQRGHPGVFRPGRRSQHVQPIVGDQHPEQRRECGHVRQQREREQVVRADAARPKDHREGGGGEGDAEERQRQRRQHHHAVVP